MSNRRQKFPQFHSLFFDYLRYFKEIVYVTVAEKKNGKRNCYFWQKTQPPSRVNMPYWHLVHEVKLTMIKCFYTIKNVLVLPFGLP